MARQLFERAILIDASEQQQVLDSKTEYLGQTFTIGTTGANSKHVVDQLGLYLNKTGSPVGNLIIEIRTVNTGLEPYQVLATATYAMASLGATQVEVLITSWDRFPTLETSTKYAIVIYVDPAATTLTGANYVTAYWNDSSLAYSGGRPWWSSNSGSTWGVDGGGIQSTDDLFFFEYGHIWSSATTDYEDIEARAGANVNLNNNAIERFEAYALQAENIVNARTRRDWTTDFSGLSANVREIITAAVSDYAAFLAINYDMSGYSNTLEGERMKETLLKDFEILVQELKLDQVKTFIDNA